MCSWAENVNIKTLGLFALVMFPYTWKFLWAPFFDSVSPVKGMGRRRGWLVITQAVLFLLITMMGLIDPKSVMSFAGITVSGVSLAAAMCFLVSMASASQDIALDALRREILKDNELGLGNSLFVNLYRLSQLVPGSLAFILADHIPWSMVYLITGLFMIPGLLATLFVVKEPQIAAGKRTFREAVSLPLKEFVSRKGVRHALLVLLFIFCYKLGDSMATSLLTRFYLDKGFTRTAIGILSKSVSLPMRGGGLRGGARHLRLHVVSGARDQSRLYGVPVRALHLARRGPPDLLQRGLRLPAGPPGLVRLLLCLRHHRGSRHAASLKGRAMERRKRPRERKAKLLMLAKR